MFNISAIKSGISTHFMPRASCPTGSLRFLLLLVSFLRKKPSGNQSVLCSRLRLAISIPTTTMTIRKSVATPTRSTLPHLGRSPGSGINSPKKQTQGLFRMEKGTSSPYIFFPLKSEYCTRLTADFFEWIREFPQHFPSRKSSQIICCTFSCGETVIRILGAQTVIDLQIHD